MQDLETALRRNTFITSVIRWWRERRLAGAGFDLDGIDDHELARLAADLSVTRDDLVALVEAGPVAGRLMERMLAAHDLAEADLRRREPDLIRDMAVLCARCEEKDRCARELDHGTAAAHAPAFCPNAPSLRALAG